MEEVKQTKAERMLTTRTKIGLTVGQTITALTLFVTIMFSYGNFAVRLSEIESKNLELAKDITQIKADIILNKEERIEQIKALRDENRDEHKQIMEGQQKIIDYLLGKR